MPHFCNCKAANCCGDEALCQQCGTAVCGSRVTWTTVPRTGREGNVCGDCMDDLQETLSQDNIAAETIVEAIVPNPQLLAEQLETVFQDNIDLSKYNGTLTAHNHATGAHRTFRIRTIKKGDLKGARVAELLSGPDNTSDYRAFGFVRDDGSVREWKRHADSLYAKYATFLTNIQWHADHGVEVLFSVKCRKCNRPLTTPESVHSGIGPICAGRE